MRATKNVLEGQDAMDLFMQGKKAWNKWAEQHEGWTVYFDKAKFLDPELTSFEDFLFPGYTSFSEAKFSSRLTSFGGALFRGREISFDSCEFNGESVVFGDATFITNFLAFYATKFLTDDIDFDSCIFHVEDVMFDKAIFNGDLSFFGSKFIESNSVSFEGTKLEGVLVLSRTQFSTVPDFRGLHINQPPLMTGMNVEYRTDIPDYDSEGNIRNRLHGSHVDMYRKLKSMAIEAKDHAREIDFFAMEERAKRGWQKNWLQYFPTLLYDFFSDFGRSIIRPAIGLGSTWLISAVVFLSILADTRICGKIGYSLLLSASHLFPFFPWSRGNRDKLIKAISDTDINKDTVIASVEAISYLESVFALIFVFLIGLALRNRFRL